MWRVIYGDYNDVNDEWCEHLSLKIKFKSIVGSPSFGSQTNLILEYRQTFCASPLKSHLWGIFFRAKQNKYMFWQKQNKWGDSKRFLRKLWSTQARPLAGIDQTIKNQAKLRQRERTICPKGYFFYTWTPLSCPMNVNILLSNKISQPFDSINVCQMHSASLNVLDLY